MKDVRFEPWVGKNYKTSGYNGKKILVIGESFYCSEEEAVATLTTIIVEDYLAIRKGEYRKNNGGWTNTYLKFERSLKGKVTTPEDYIDLLARLSAEDQKQIFELYYQVQSYEQEGPVKRR